MYDHINITTKLTIIIVFLALSLMLKTLVDTLISLFVAPRFRFRCSQASFFGWVFTNNNGKWSSDFEMPSPLCHSIVIIDKNKMEGSDWEKLDKRYMTARAFILLLISVPLLIIGFPAILRTPGAKATVPDIIFAAFSAGFFFHCMSSIVIMIYTQTVMMKGLGGYIQSLINRMRAGEAFYSLNMRPLGELGYEKVTDAEKMMYNAIYVEYLFSLERFDELRQPTYEMTDYLLHKEFNPALTLNYYWLIFYYSRLEKNPAIADSLVEKMGASLTSDKDSNARRVLAYYQYGIKGNVRAAKRYVDEGLAVIESFSFPQERELERKLLLELDKELMYESMER